MKCNAPNPTMFVVCTLSKGHSGPHAAILFTTPIASWPNVPGPTAVPVAPTTPAQPADPAPTGTLPGAPDPNGTTAPDPRPKPIDYSDWLSEEDLL